MASFFYRFMPFFQLCLPYIQGDWHHSVKNDDIGPKGKEGRKEKVVNRRVPWEIALKKRPHFSLPHSISNGQYYPHTHQETKNLMKRGERRKNKETAKDDP